MSPRKLTDSDKQEILDLYRTPQETTSTLAERYQVSSSTISRFLKTHLPENEYEELIQQKRLSRTPTGAAQVLSQFSQKQPTPEKPDEVADEKTAPSVKRNQPTPQKLGEVADEKTAPSIKRKQPTPQKSEEVADDETAPSIKRKQPTPQKSEEVADDETAPSVKRTRRRSSASTSPSLKSSPQRKAPILRSKIDDFEVEEEEEVKESVEVPVLKTILEEDLDDIALDEEEDLDDEDFEEEDLDDEDFEEDFEEEDDNWQDEDEDEDEDEDSLPRPIAKSDNIQVLPLADAPLPGICYLVVDRAAELVTPPLREFGDLGEIPTDEVQQKTLPVFDNHRVARRFSKRSHRVIKVPDSQMLVKTGACLEAKGITRLLINGRVYALR
ncbi:MAG: transposase [Cyanobacteriota bacterium]|nr:transposase [Cyanobacteriota bacterium]